MDKEVCEKIKKIEEEKTRLWDEHIKQKARVNRINRLLETEKTILFKIRQKHQEKHNEGASILKKLNLLKEKEK